MTKERLWAPWRMEYIKTPKDKNEGCVFCISETDENDRDNLILFRGQNAFIIMNLYPYNNAHLMIVPYLHVSDTSPLETDTLKEVMVLADKTMEILRKTINPQGFNFGANIGTAGGAGIQEHIHFHILPRWVGDTNFMPIIGQTKVMIQGMFDTYDDLKPHFDKLK